ncbi:MAG: flagellar motor switch protein FliN [Chlorobiota bacterium]|jgi:flagellar motor switch protein FliN/FliY|nr:flagellar motor switch protein FliN [Chlorobiota bacterium]
METQETQQEFQEEYTAAAEASASAEEQPSSAATSTQQGEASELLSDPRLELLYSIQLPVSVELGRTTMYIRDILRLGRGSVIEFDRLISDPVDILIDGKKVAEGEVVVIDKHFGIRITTLVEPAERLRGLRR